MKSNWWFLLFNRLSFSGNSLAQPLEIANKEDREVTVVASRSQARLDSMPLHTTLISQEDIKKKSSHDFRSTFKKHSWC
jgi:outer membrane receptor for ferrienterochelin and colicin